MKKNFKKDHLVPFLTEKLCELNEELCFIEEHHKHLDTEISLLHDIMNLIKSYLDEEGVR